MDHLIPPNGVAFNNLTFLLCEVVSSHRARGSRHKIEAWEALPEYEEELIYCTDG